jgi:hypothetical protein
MEFELDIETSFKDTIDFFNYLPNLHVLLNHIIERDTEIQYELIKNRPESLDSVKDENIRKLLDKDINLIIYFDLSEILAYFHNIKNSKLF